MFTLYSLTSELTVIRENDDAKKRTEAEQENEYSEEDSFKDDVNDENDWKRRFEHPYLNDENESFENESFFSEDKIVSNNFINKTYTQINELTIIPIINIIN